MKSIFRRHLSYANVMATIAVFAALCGGAYAASGAVNGKKIVNRSIAGKKLKNGTVTSKQIKKNSLNASVINISTLGTVPSAQTAASATTAETAASAAKATVAESAGKAAFADSATSAKSADTATSANRATTAEDADTLNGITAKQLIPSCQPESELYGGMCWDDATRPTGNWISASIECGDDGGRLPTLSELIAFVFRPGTQVTGQTWSSDVADFVGEKEIVLTTDENTTETFASSPTSLGFRCVFEQSIQPL